MSDRTNTSLKLFHEYILIIVSEEKIYLKGYHEEMLLFELIFTEKPLIRHWSSVIFWGKKWWNYEL